MANSNRRNNTLDSLVVNGSISSNFIEIMEHIVQYYNQLYSKQINWRTKSDGLSFNSNGADEGFWLERAFKESEVY